MARLTWRQARSAVRYGEILWWLRVVESGTTGSGRGYKSGTACVDAEAMGKSGSAGSVKTVSTLSTSSKKTTDLEVEAEEDGRLSERRALENRSASRAGAEEGMAADKGR